MVNSESRISSDGRAIDQNGIQTWGVITQIICSILVSYTSFISWSKPLVFSTQAVPSLRNVVDNVLDCDIVVSEFEFQSRY